MLEIEKVLDGGYSVIFEEKDYEITLVFHENTNAILYVIEHKNGNKHGGAITNLEELREVIGHYQ